MTNNSPIIITSVVGGGGLLLVSITVLVIVLCLCHARSHNRRVNATHIHLVKNNSVSLNMYRGTVPRSESALVCVRYIRPGAHSCMCMYCTFLMLSSYICAQSDGGRQNSGL